METVSKARDDNCDTRRDERDVFTNLLVWVSGTLERPSGCSQLSKTNPDGGRSKNEHIYAYARTD